MKYKTIDNRPTPYPGEHKPWHQRLLRYLYKKYVNYPYLPEDCEVVAHNPTVPSNKPCLTIKHSTVCNEYHFFSKVGEKDKDRLHFSSY